LFVPLKDTLSCSIFSFICMFCRSLFVILYFFLWPLCCLFFNLRILITSLVSSSFHFLRISLFRFVLVDFVLLSLVSFHFIFISLISFRFVSLLLISFRFVFVDFEVQMSYFYLCLCVCQYLWIIKFLEWAYRKKWGIWGGIFIDWDIEGSLFVWFYYVFRLYST
jgi:hypothetical protein